MSKSLRYLKRNEPNMAPYHGENGIHIIDLYKPWQTDEGCFETNCKSVLLSVQKQAKK